MFLVREEQWNLLLVRDTGPGKSPVVLVDVSPINRRNSRRKKGGLNFPLKHRVRDRRDSLKALFPGYFKFTIRAQRDVRRQMDSGLMILCTRRKSKYLVDQCSRH